MQRSALLFVFVAAVGGFAFPVSAQEGDEFVEDSAIEEEPLEEEPLEEEPLEAEYRVDTVLISAEELARVGGAAHRLDEEDLEALEYDDPVSVLQQVPAVFEEFSSTVPLHPGFTARVDAYGNLLITRSAS